MKVVINEQIFKMLNENDWKEVSPDEEDWAIDFLKQGVDENWNIGDWGYFFIDVSGRHSVYYTLWRFKPSKSQHVKPLTFWQNLSQQFKPAVEKAKRIAGVTPIYLDKTGTKSADNQRREKITFGKYRDEFFSDIFQKDPKYFTWLWDQIRKGALNKISPNNYDQIEYYNQMYWETVKQKNIETSTSKHVGEIGTTYQGELTVTKISQPKHGAYGEYRVYTLVDGETNQFVTYNLDKSVKKEVNVGDKFKLKGQIDGHKEFLGINQTFLKRVKLAE